MRPQQKGAKRAQAQNGWERGEAAAPRVVLAKEKKGLDWSEEVDRQHEEKTLLERFRV